MDKPCPRRAARQLADHSPAHDRARRRARDVDQAAHELLAVLKAHPYLTCLYTRLSAEEMTGDPVLGRSGLGDLAREHPVRP